MIGLRSAALIAIVLVVVGCGTDEALISASPSSSRPTPLPDPAAIALKNLMGAFRPKAVAVNEDVAAVVRDACLAAADPVLSFGLKDQPVVLAEGRGLGLVSLILADDDAAFECRATITEDGTSATAIEPPSRLDPNLTSQPEIDEVSLVSQTRLTDPATTRTIVIGRVGPKAEAVGVTFNDETEVVAALASGWFLAWWPTDKVPGGIVSANRRNEVLDGWGEPTQILEGRVVPAQFWLDSAKPRPSPKSTTIAAIMRELTCGGEANPTKRRRDPTVATTDQAVTITLWVARLPGGDCPANPQVPIEITLPAALGTRAILDGSQTPPRDASLRPPD